MSKEIVYAGIFLMPQARDLLLSLCPPKYPVIYADHMTHVVTPEPRKLKMELFGKLFRLRVKESYDNGEIQCVRVEVTSPLVSPKGWVPHITISSLPEVGPITAKAVAGVEEYAGEYINSTVFGVYAPFYSGDKKACAPIDFCGVCHRCSMFMGPNNAAYAVYNQERRSN